MRYLALLRGINVGGNNKLPMKDLKEICGAVGCRNVVTFIQSGNAVFDAPASGAAKLAKSITAEIERVLGLRIPVILRTGAELEEALAGDPFLQAGADTDHLHIVFLADVPDPAAVAKLDSARALPDEFAVVGKHVYLLAPNGLGRSRLATVLSDSRLSTVGTARNWRTCLKLNELMKS